MSEGRILVAKQSFSVRFEGADVLFREGITRVREGHPILTKSNSKDITYLFEPITPHYEVEQATAAPGETRPYTVRRRPGRPPKKAVA